MRIGMIAPLEMRVPPIAYGGTEMIVSLLTEELIRRGHELSLFASGDSKTSAQLEAVCDRFLRGTDREKNVLTLLNVVRCMEEADQFDIIHNHTVAEGMSLAGLVRPPVLTTLHGGIHGDWALVFERYRGWYNAISKSAASLLPSSSKARYAGVVYNAIDCASYPFNGGQRDDFLLFLSRISHEKGAHLAIEIARKTGRRLLIAGNVDAPDQEYFETKVQPYVDGDQIQYLGEADHFQKRDLLCRTQCLLAPVTWNEPFGLFMVEAMACGAPVVAINRGSVPEVVCHGVTGFVVDTEAEMQEAIGQVHRIEPANCRRHVEFNFDVPLMADNYVKVYKRVLRSANGRRSDRSIHITASSVALDLTGRPEGGISSTPSSP